MRHAHFVIPSSESLDIFLNRLLVALGISEKRMKEKRLRKKTDWRGGIKNDSDRLQFLRYRRSTENANEFNWTPVGVRLAARIDQSR